MNTIKSAMEEGTRTQHNKRSYAPWLLTLTFVLPFALAYLVLEKGWYQGGATNNGQLLQGLSYTQLNQSNPAEGKWQLITSAPAICEQRCQHRVELIQQIQVALGRERPRVRPLVFTSETELAVQGDALTVLSGQDSLINALKPYSMVIVDPLGQWVMGYPKVDSEEALQRQSRDLLMDFRKLLKLSRIG